MLAITQSHLVRYERGQVSDRELAGLLYWHGRCTSTWVDPDDWFPVAQDTAKAREQAAEAIAVCVACPVRAGCLEFALRHGYDFGAHGVWGGLVEQERRRLRRRWLAGTAVKELLGT